MRFSVDLAKHRVGVALQCSSKTGSNTRHSRHRGPRKSTSTNWRRPTTTRHQQHHAKAGRDAERSWRDGLRVPGVNRSQACIPSFRPLSQPAGTPVLGASRRPRAKTRLSLMTWHRMIDWVSAELAPPSYRFVAAGGVQAGG